MKQSFTIPGRLDGLNEYTRACRTKAGTGAKMKRDNQNLVCQIIKLSRLKPMQGKVDITYIWHEKPCKKNGAIRDKDNIRFAAKFINDALVDMGIIKDDGWRHVGILRDEFYRTSGEARIEVILEEV